MEHYHFCVGQFAWDLYGFSLDKANAWACARALNFQVQWGVILVTCSIVIVLPTRGLPEIAMTTLYTFLGVPPTITATATMLTRILTFWLRFFVGFAAQQWLEIKTVAASVRAKTIGF